jgi:hypothetical protein
MTADESDIFIELLSHRFAYRYEYLGSDGASTTVWHDGFEKAIFALLTAYRMKRFPMIQGNEAAAAELGGGGGGGEGKLTAVKEVAGKMLGRPLMIRTITKAVDGETIDNVRRKNETLGLDSTNRLIK